MEAGRLPAAYAPVPGDRVRQELEGPWLAGLARRLLRHARGSRVLELGAGAGVGSLLGADDYTGVDFRPPAAGAPGAHVLHDLRHGIGPVGTEPFDLYLAGFGLASHLAPGELRRLLTEIARHGRPGSMVAVEALGLYSLEWPGAWGRPQGEARMLPYRLAGETLVHPWAAGELTGMAAAAGLRPLGTHDRTLQAGPKTGDGRYWPGLPPLRAGLDTLLAGGSPPAALSAPLPPLPAGPAAAVHQRLAARRRALVAGHRGRPQRLGEALWAMESGSGGGFGHGLVVVARVP